MKRMKCLIDGVVIRVTSTGLAERVAIGQVVDFDRVLSRGFTVGDAVRAEWFEAVDKDNAFQRTADGAGDDEGVGNA